MIFYPSHFPFVKPGKQIKKPLINMCLYVLDEYFSIEVAVSLKLITFFLS
jgi:hypothetical protein